MRRTRRTAGPLRSVRRVQRVWYTHGARPSPFRARPAALVSRGSCNRVTFSKSPLRRSKRDDDVYLFAISRSQPAAHSPGRCAFPCVPKIRDIRDRSRCREFVNSLLFACAACSRIRNKSPPWFDSVPFVFLPEGLLVSCGRPYFWVIESCCVDQTWSTSPLWSTWPTESPNWRCSPCSMLPMPRWPAWKKTRWKSSYDSLNSSLWTLEKCQCFDNDHVSWLLVSRSRSFPDAVKFSREHPLSCWISSMLAVFAGSLFTSFLLGEPVIGVFNSTDQVVLATAVWWEWFSSQFVLPMDYRHENEDFLATYREILVSMNTPDRLLLDSTPNLGPLISCWDINKIENFWYKSVRILEVLKLSFQQFWICQVPNKIWVVQY